MTESPLSLAVTDLATPLAASLGLELWGVELAFGGRSLVRIFVESDNGVSIDQCAELSRLLGLSLDVEDLMPGAYVLEVSSPGMERTFFTEQQLARAVGQRVEITLHTPKPAWPGRKKFRGLLQKAPAGLSGIASADAVTTASVERFGLASAAAAATAPADVSESAAARAAAAAATADACATATADVCATATADVCADVSAPTTAGALAAVTDEVFALKAEELARPGEDEPLVSFVFAELKKAVQAPLFSDQPLQGKPSSRKKAAPTPKGKERAKAAQDSPDTAEL